jgi:hypothetical protein
MTTGAFHDHETMVCAIWMVATRAASSANQTQTESELDQSKDIHKLNLRYVLGAVAKLNTKTMHERRTLLRPFSCSVPIRTPISSTCPYLNQPGILLCPSL